MAQAVVIAPCGVSNVTVSGAPAADYFEQADELLGAARPSGANAWLPYGISLTNRASQNIDAIAVRWVVTNERGQTSTFSATSMMFDQPKQQLPPGKSVIAVPGAVIGPPGASRQFPLTHLTDFQSARKVQVNLDGVVFASGQFAGPNIGKVYEEFVAETTVPAHVAATILAMRELGETVNTMVTWLETLCKPQSTDRNAQIKARTAKLFLADYKRGGEALLFQRAEGYEKSPGIRLYR